MARDTTHEEKLAILERRKRVLRRWAIAIGVLAVLSFIGLGGMILDRVLKGAAGGGLEINWSKVEKKLAWLGAEIRDIENTISEQLSLTSTDGVLVNNVTPGSPADDAGLERGDVILSIDRTEIANSLQIQEEIRNYAPGDTVRLYVDKANGGRRNIYVEFGVSPDDVTPSQGSNIVKTANGASGTAAPVLPTSWGISVSPLTEELREKFNIPASERGIVIVAVVKNSPADAQGLEVGDVIESINRTGTPNLQSFYLALQGNEAVLLDIYSPDDGKRFFATLPDEGDSPPQAVLMSFTEQTPAKNRIAVASDSDNLDAAVYARFAASPYFIVYDISSREMTAIRNPYAGQVRGMGIVVAQMLTKQNIDAAIVGGIGPQAFDTLYLAKVKVYGPVTGTVRNAIMNYQLAKLKELKEANLGGYGYSSGATIATGGSPWTEDSDDEEESDGYQGQPQTIPPKGKPGSDLALTAKSEPRSNRPEICVCPNCGAEVTHPSSVSCSDMTCPICGSKLMTASPGGESSGATDTLAQLPATQIPTQIRPVAGVSVAPSVPPSRIAAQRTANNLWALSSKPDNIPPVGAQLTAGASGQLPSGSQVSTCVCPLDGTTVTHPVGVPCAALQCPVCGGRMVSGNNVVLTAGNPMTATAGIRTGGKPDDVPPVQQVFYLVPVSSKPENIPPLGQQGVQVVFVPTAGGPPQGDTGGGPSSAGPAVDGQSQGGGQAGSGAAQSGRSILCVCPMCKTTVTHPIGVPCASLTCPICGSRLVNAQPGGASGGVAVQTGGKPDDVPPVQQVFYLVPVSSKPENIPPLGQQGVQVVFVPTAGGPPQGDTGGGPSSAGPAVDGQSQGGGQAGSGAAQSGRSILCVCPMCKTTVTHPIGVPCASLTCPICGSRLVNAQPGGASGGVAVQTGGKPDDVPPVRQVFYLVPVSSKPENIPPLGQQGVQVVFVPTAGGPAVDGQSQGGQAGSGAPQSARSTQCICLMCKTTVTHPIGVPCASLTCPVCGSRMVNAQPAGASAGTAMKTAAGVQVAQSKVVQVSTTSRKVVVPSTGRSLKSDIAPLLDNAPYFIMVGLGKTEVVKNPYSRDKRAIGAQVAQFIVGEGGAVVICDNVSMAALKTFKDLQVKVYTGFTGSVQQALDIYQDGRLKDSGTTSGVIVDETADEHGGGGGGGPPSSKTKSKDKDGKETF